MNNFKRFQERNTIRAKSTDSGNKTFILKGYNSTIITNNQIQINAAVVNQQEKDAAYIYTPLEDTLPIGSIWETKTLHFLITEEIITIKDVEWHKYLAQLCNINIDNSWGYFIGPEKSYINTALKEKSIIISNQKPVLVAPANTLKCGDKIVIRNRPWLVQEYDSISTPGIDYYSLVPTTVSAHIAKENQDKEIYIERAVEQYQDNTNIQQHLVAHNIEIVVSTENAYFKYDTNIKIISRREKEVTFILPFGIDIVTIETQQDNQLITTVYKAVQ